MALCLLKTYTQPYQLRGHCKAHQQGYKHLPLSHGRTTVYLKPVTKLQQKLLGFSVYMLPYGQTAFHACKLQTPMMISQSAAAHSILLDHEYSCDR